MLKQFAVNPQLWKQAFQRSTTRSMSRGSLIDCLLLTPSLFDSMFVLRPTEFDSFRSKDARVWRDHIEAQGLTSITYDELLDAQNCVNVIRTNADARPFIGVAGDPQTALRNDDGDTAVKALLDFLPQEGPNIDAIVDLKTIDCSPDQFTMHKILSQISEFDYHISGAWYLQLFNSLADVERRRFVMVFACQQPPFPVAVVELAKPDIESGAAICRFALERFVTCCETDAWPSPFAGRVSVVSRRLWAFEHDQELINELIA